MATFMMFGKYSAEGLKEASADRTKKAVKLAKKYDGKITAMYALLGEHDLLLITDFPDGVAAMKASIALGKMTGISFSTLPAVPVEEFDKMLEEA
ncbi:GYD domain-containing protein [bacterium]|nr:GYD domain-containing protein [bacterium]